MKSITGKVVSNKVDHTLVVEVVRFMAHPLYHKRIRLTKKYHAHTNTKQAIGDVVKIIPCRPISKTKTFKVIENLNKVSHDST